MSKKKMCSNLTSMGGYKLELELDDLWRRLGLLKEAITKALDDPHSSHEREQLLELARITGAHTYFVIEIGAQHREGQPIPDAGLREMLTLIEQHCDDGISSVQSLINEQTGFKLQAVRVI